MKKLLKTWYIKGFLIGAIINLIANLITFKSPEFLNVLVGGILGIAVYYLFHLEWIT